MGVVNSALDNLNDDQDASINKRIKGTNRGVGRSVSLVGGGGSINDLEQRVRVLTGFGHRGHHTSTLSSR